MNKVTLVENPLDASTWVEHEIEDVYSFLVDHFKIWPKNAHIYLDHIAKNSDITPYDAFGAERITKIKGHFYVVVYPEGIETILLVTALVVAAVSIGISFLLRPSVNTKNQQEKSANNTLSDRQNQARPNERIPDIYGQLRSTFDLIAVPYKVFITNQEVEYCYFCIGRGEYQVDDIRDGITDLNDIEGASAEVYGPNTSPNGGAPVLTIGTAIATPVINISKFDGVNGQVLDPPNQVFKGDNSDIEFVYPNKIVNSGFADFRDYFIPSVTGHDHFLTIGEFNGFTVKHGQASDPSMVVGSVFLYGAYRIVAVTATQITIDDGVGGAPSNINSNWNVINTFGGAHSRFDTSDGLGDYLHVSNAAGASATDNFINPFIVLRKDITQVWANFVAPNGAFYIDKKGNQHVSVVTCQLKVQGCDLSGNPIGSPTTATVNINGSTNDRSQKGATIKLVLPVGIASSGGIIITARRSSDIDTDDTHQVSDQVQWRDLYFVAPAGFTNFGNVTTVQTVIKATPSAIDVKARKLNGLVTRKVPTYLGGTSFGAVAPSTNAADIICAMAFDPFIGRRVVSEVDVVGIYAVAGPGGTIQRYFATFPDVTLPTQFCYTFDDSKVSFEESMVDLTTAIFCQAFRRGSKLELSFEQQTAQSVLLFNHRNKIPRSESRTMSFGMLNDNDGITITYVEPNAPNYPNVDTQVTLYFPTDQSAKNPKKVDTIGIRNLQQAKLFGWRLYKKLLYQNLIVQFDATEETAILVLQDRILVADNTRSDTQDGEVLSVLVLELTLSQAVVFDARFNYTIFLQLSDGSIDSIPITAGSSPNKVILGHAPLLALVTDVDKFARTTYMVVNDGPTRQTACLLLEKNPKDRNIYEVKAVNYDDEYYTHDNDYKSNVDVAQLIVEVVQPPAVCNADIAQLVIEVVT